MRAPTHRSVLASCLSLLLLGGLALAAEPEPQVVAIVNGQTVLLESLERQLGRMHASAEETQRSGFDLDRLMFRVVNDVLLSQEARALGMHEETSVIEQVEERRHELALKRIQQVEIADRDWLGHPEVGQLRSMRLWPCTVMSLPACSV